MASIISSIQDLITSLFEVIGSVFNTAFHLVENAFGVVISFFEGILNMFTELFKDGFKAVGGVTNFILGNFFVLAIIGLGSFAFLQYQKKQGRPVKVGNKKLN